MNRTPIKFTLIVCSLLLIASCSEGGGGTPSYTGQYIDAPVKGLAYTALPSGLKGTTDSSGNFNFQSGDTVTFNIVTPGGNISAGSVSPSTPSSTSTTVPISVLMLPNATQIAQTLQSLGGTSGTIDVSSSSANVQAISTSTAVSSINSFVSSGGSTSQPSQITVSPTSAQQSAISSMASLTSTTNSVSVSSVLPGSTIFWEQFFDLASVNGVSNTSFEAQTAGINYYVNAASTSSGNSVSQMCFYLPVLKNTNNYSINLCSNGGTVNTSSGVVSYMNSNSFTETFTGGTSTTTVSVLNPVTGYYSQTQSNPATNSGGSSLTWTGNGTYWIIDNSITNTTFSNKTISVSGNSYCSDGIMNYVLNSTGTSYTNVCKTSASSGSGFISGGGSITAVSNLPGILLFTDASNTSSAFYVGMLKGGTTSSGTFVVGRVGTSGCYSSITSPSNCGSIGTYTYTAQ